MAIYFHNVTRKNNFTACGRSIPTEHTHWTSIADDIVSAIGKCRITDVINSVLEMDLPSDTTVEQFVSIKKNMPNLLKKINETDIMKESGATLTYFKMNGKVVQ